MRSIDWKAVLSVLVAAACMAVAPPASAQFGLTTAQVEKFSEHKPDNKRSIDFSAIDEILTNFVLPTKDSTIVRYGLMKGLGSKMLDNFIINLGSIDISKLTRDQQLAYWLNLRMLMVFQTTSAAYPAANPKYLLAPNSGFLNTPIVTVRQAKLSISDVDRILLRHWSDTPYIIFGMIVPAKGGPAVPQEAFVAKNVHQQLQAKARKFLSRAGTMKVSKNQATLSEFILWKKAFLGNDDAKLTAFLSKYVSEQQAARLTGVTRLKGKFNWGLNEYRERRGSKIPRRPPIGAGGAGGAAGGRVGG